MKEYVESRKRKICEKIIERIVEITNELYSTQKQHTKFQLDQSYYGLKKIRDLFELDDEEDFTAVFVRLAFNGKLKEYEIAGSTKVITFNEYLDKIRSSLLMQLEAVRRIIKVN